MGTSMTSRSAKRRRGVEEARHCREMLQAGLLIHGDHGAVGRRERHQVRLGHWPGPAEEDGLALEERALTPEVDVDEVPALPAVVFLGRSSGLKMIPPAHSDRIQSTERSGPVHTSESRPPGRSTRATSGTARSSSTQCQADWAITRSTDDVAAGNSSARPARTSTRASLAASTARMRSSGSTAVRWATRSARSRREDACTGSDLEDIGRVLGNEPVERFIRWA